MRRMVLLLCLLVAAARAQGRVHPWLAERLEETPPGRKLPVYFVLSDRLGADHWYPRVLQLPIDARRALVVRELKEHARLTQARLLEVLHRRAADGATEGIFTNWLGNFVQCHATRSVIEEAAALPGVAEIWYDHEPPLSEVQDAAAAPAGPPQVSSVGFGSSNPNAGDGPTATHADQVWCLGITGQGVVIMNSDGGINAGHLDLQSRLWTNPGEIPGNGVDDDGNGKVDDVHGWNFATNNAQLDDMGGHGTRTAGCLVADGTCNGVILGQAPGAHVMTGLITGEVSQWNALQYALAMGAHTQTSSYSFKNSFLPPPNYRMHRDVADNTLAAGLIRTNSPSNNGSQCAAFNSADRRPFNVSAPACVPCPWTDPNQTLVGAAGGVLAIGAHDPVTGLLMAYSPCGPFAWSLADLLVVLPTYPVANWNSPLHDDYPWGNASQLGLLKPDLTAPTNTTTTSTGTCGTAVFNGTSNATPNAHGCMVLWKSANMSLGPEDIAMIAHQTASPSGAVPGKENAYGAGRMDARAGLDLALCVHRVDGRPAWSVTHAAGTPVSVGIDGVPGSHALIALGTVRTQAVTSGGVVGVGGTAFVLWEGWLPPSGDLALQVPVPSSLAGLTVYTQAFLDDATVTGSILSSNVIETRLL